jgi:hypothetical protein
VSIVLNPPNPSCTGDYCFETKNITKFSAHGCTVGFPTPIPRGPFTIAFTVQNIGGITGFLADLAVIGWF